MSQFDAQDERLHTTTHNSEPWIISFRDTSQYSKGGPSACGLAAVNAARDILTTLSSSDTGSDPLDHLKREETATSIMSICSFWESNEHLDVQDILNLPFFSCHLETKRVEDNQCGAENFIKLTKSLESDGVVAAVVTRSPEIVAVINAPATPFGNITIVFDSHPRPEHPLGAAFLMFQKAEDAAAYLDKLFAVDPAILRDLSWQTQMLSRYSAHVIGLKYSTEEETLASVYEANIKLLNYGENIKGAVSREAATQAELLELREVLKRQRDAREKACLAEEEAARKLKDLRKEVENARQFVLSLVNPEIGNGPPAYRGTGSHNSHPHDHKPGRGDELSANGRGISATIHSAGKSSSGSGWGNSGLQGQKSSSASQYYGYHKTTRKREEKEVREKDRRGGTSTSSMQNPHGVLGTDDPDLRLALELQKQFEAQFESERVDFERARRLQMEDDQLRLQREELLRAADTDKGFSCQLCLEDYSEGNIARVESCGHGTCRSCMRGHINSQLEQRRWPIICAICVAQLDRDDELGVISRDLAEMVGADEEMMKAWIQIEIERVAVKVECPTCHKAVYVDVEDFNQTEMLWCQDPACNAYWCKKCSQLAERGFRHTCDGEAEMERWLEGERSVKKCPGCQALVQRKEGCYHMTCSVPGCNTHFCDRCGKMLIQSRKKKDVDAAVNAHFNGQCQLFDIPDEP